MNDFLSSPWWGVLGLALTLIFGALSIYLYFKSRRFKQVVFTCLFSTLQTRNHPDISILFKGNEIKDLSKVLVLCWNSGNEEIRKVDVPSKECPTIVFGDDARILSYKVLEQTSPSLNFTVEQLDEHTLNIRFEYLNPKEGGLIEILYENLVGGSIKLNLDAQIIGGRNTLVKRYEKGTGPVLIFMPLVLASIIGFLTFSAFIKAGIAGIVIGTFGLMMIGISIYGAWLNTKSYMSKRVPNFAVKYFEGKS